MVSGAPSQTSIGGAYSAPTPPPPPPPIPFSCCKREAPPLHLAHSLSSMSCMAADSCRAWTSIFWASTASSHWALASACIQGTQRDSVVLVFKNHFKSFKNYAMISGAPSQTPMGGAYSTATIIPQLQLLGNRTQLSMICLM